MLAAVQCPYDSYLPLISKRFHPLEDPLAADGAITSLDLPEHPNEFKTDYDEPTHSSCQKLLLSATLTSDPGKIASLGLRDPKYFVVREYASGATGGHHVVSENFSMPTNLAVRLCFTLLPIDFSQSDVKEHMIVCDPSRKPLILFYLAHARRVDSALVFTKSAESTARLVRLFELFEEISPMPGDRKLIIRAYSSDLPPSERRSILEQFKDKKIGM